MKKLSLIFNTILILLVFGCATTQYNRRPYRDFELLKEALTMISKNYIEEMNYTELFDKTIKSFQENEAKKLQISSQGAGNYNVSCYDNSITISESYFDKEDFIYNLEQIQPLLKKCSDDKSTNEERNYEYLFIKHLLISLDPHSNFMPTKVYKGMQGDTIGEFGGLGIQIGLKYKKLVIISPIEDTPAWRAGIKAGDQIFKIDSVNTKDMNLNDAVEKMRGPKGTKVTLTINREREKDPMEITIVRDEVRWKKWTPK